VCGDRDLAGERNDADGRRREGFGQAGDVIELRAHGRRRGDAGTKRGLAEQECDLSAGLVEDRLTT
jgi:hypothetical protein